MSEDGLAALLQESINWNKDNNITGMLLYIKSDLLQHKEGRFIQALEGNEADVREIFEKIKKDDRHSNVSVLNESYLSYRNFTNWSMGFKSLDAKEYLASPGRFELDGDFLKYDPISALNPALDFIKQFYSLNLNFGRINKATL